MAVTRKIHLPRGTDPLFGKAVDQPITNNSSDYANSSQIGDEACPKECLSADEATGYLREEEEVESMREEAS